MFLVPKSAVTWGKRYYLCCPEDRRGRIFEETEPNKASGRLPSEGIGLFGDVHWGRDGTVTYLTKER